MQRYSKKKKKAAGRNVLNFNVKCLQGNGSFLHPAKKADAHQLLKTKKKKTAKISLKKTKPKDRWKENAKKKKNETSGQNSIANC